MTKLVDMKVWIDSTSVTGRGCVLVAPEGHVFKSNLDHEIVVQVEEQEQSIKRTIAIWKRIDEILEAGLMEVEPPTDVCGYCSKEDAE
jgi:hypothetical protein